MEIPEFDQENAADIISAIPAEKIAARITRASDRVANRSVLTSPADIAIVKGESDRILSYWAVPVHLAVLRAAWIAAGSPGDEFDSWAVEFVAIDYIAARTVYRLTNDVPEEDESDE